jgi:hypothetical protein
MLFSSAFFAASSFFLERCPALNGSKPFKCVRLLVPTRVGRVLEIAPTLSGYQGDNRGYQK